MAGAERAIVGLAVGGVRGRAQDVVQVAGDVRAQGDGQSVPGFEGEVAVVGAGGDVRHLGSRCPCRCDPPGPPPAPNSHFERSKRTKLPSGGSQGTHGAICARSALRVARTPRRLLCSLCERDDQQENAGMERCARCVSQELAMITRLYANNFRCLVGFEATFDSFGVLCGPNGAGKSSVFDALCLLRGLCTGDGLLGGTGEHDVPRLELTQWLDSRIQEFELSLSVGGTSFDYVIHIEQTTDSEKPRVIHERALCDKKPLFERDLEGVRFLRADGKQASFPLDWRQAALAAIQPRGVNISKLALLQEEIAKLLILRPNPRSMESESKAEARHPDLSMSNLTSWYRSLAQEQEWTDALRDALRDVWPDFRSFKQVEVGMNAKALQLRFEIQGGKPVFLFLDQLSDGERALIGLYMVRSALETGAARTVLIDEPDNFVGLPELQPWVLSMRELLDDEHQLVLVSHHPEVLANSGEANGHYVWRDNHTSPTRVGPLNVPEGMTAGEALVRGWARGE